MVDISDFGIDSSFSSTNKLRLLLLLQVALQILKQYSVNVLANSHEEYWEYFWTWQFFSIYWGIK